MQSPFFVIPYDGWTYATLGCWAAKGVGVTIKKEPADSVRVVVADRGRRIEQILADRYALGLGPDITDRVIMQAARR